jgi:hypothetical protein
VPLDASTQCKCTLDHSQLTLDAYAHKDVRKVKELRELAKDQASHLNRPQHLGLAVAHKIASIPNVRLKPMDRRTMASWTDALSSHFQATMCPTQKNLTVTRQWLSIVPLT